MMRGQRGHSRGQLRGHESGVMAASVREVSIGIARVVEVLAMRGLQDITHAQLERRMMRPS